MGQTQTLQREVLKSRRYLLKFLARRGSVSLKKAWTQSHTAWLRQLASEASPMVDEDRVVFREYLALLEYKLAGVSWRSRRPRSGSAEPLAPHVT